MQPKAKTEIDRTSNGAKLNRMSHRNRKEEDRTGQQWNETGRKEVYGKSFTTDLEKEKEENGHEKG
jgi:hypothetical protein